MSKRPHTLISYGNEESTLAQSSTSDFEFQREGNMATGTSANVASRFALQDWTTALETLADGAIVALQLPDDALSSAVSLVSALEERWPRLRFVLAGDTSFGSCCVDFATPLRIAPSLSSPAEDSIALLVHVGHACGTLPDPATMPCDVLYVYPADADAPDLLGHAREWLNPDEAAGPTLVFFDSFVESALPADPVLRRAWAAERGLDPTRVILASPLVRHLRVSATGCTDPADHRDSHVLSFFGRCFHFTSPLPAAPGAHDDDGNDGNDALIFA
mmetsp:Transcript_515/g.1577  ORF Transcript_515/g.1577 Transcript_515/m.1577 type:complete len:275 (-) Transcript_515:26-850(-)